MVEGKDLHRLPREGFIILLLGITVVLVTMNTAMFNLALVDLSRQFHIPPSTVSLTVTCYSIMFAISSITYSRLSDFVPIRHLFAISLILTGGSSVVAMFVGHFWLLLFTRIVQAVGAGGALSLSVLLITRYIPLARRGKSMTFIMSSVSMGFGLGPLIGGVVVQYVGWKYLFAITSLVLCILPLLLREIPKESFSKRPFDLIGVLSLSIGASGTLLFLSNYSLISLLIGIVGILVFTFRVLRTTHSFLPASLFVDKIYFVLSLIGVMSYLCNFATLFLLPQMLVRHFSLSASAAGFIIFPGAALSMILSRKIGTIIDQRGNRGMLLSSPLLIVVAGVLFASVGTHSWVGDIFEYVLMNVGFTMVNSSVYNEISRLLPSSQIGAGIGVYQLMQFFSGAFGVAVLSSTLGWQRATVYAGLFWGLASVALLAALCALLYVRPLAQRNERPVAKGQ